MKRRMVLGAGLFVVWLFVVFLVTLRLSFPSKAVADRLAWEVQKGSGGQYELQMRDLTPWRVGASANAIRVLRHDPRTPDAQPTLAFAAEKARVRVGLWSLIRQEPRLTGSLKIGSGDVDFVVGTAAGSAGPSLYELQLEAPSLGIGDLALLTGGDFEGTGKVQVRARLLAPEGLSRSEGQMKVSGRDLSITRLDLSSMGVPDLGMEIPIEDLDVTLDVRLGRATVSRGLLKSSLATIRIDGDVSLRDDLPASIMNLEFVVTDLGPELQPFRAFLGSPWRDGGYHYRCTGTFERSHCRAESERGSKAGTNRPGGRGGGARSVAAPERPSEVEAPQPSTRPPNMGRPTTTTGVAERPTGPPRTDDPMTEEDRERRREELRERLRKRREQMRARTGLTADREAEEPDEDFDEFDDDEDLDEDLEDDELY